MSPVLSLIFLFILFGLELLYFKIAEKFRIVDIPNHRSSHNRVTIRGGGIIFPVALLLCFLFIDSSLNYFVPGLLLISLISFWDDIKPLSNKIRIIGHLAAVSLLFFQTDIIMFPMWAILIAYILVIGTINAYNFMDGINGITGGYSIVVISSLWYVNQFQIPFVDNVWLIASFLALLVFNFYNFRTKAKCFAGDVGSISIAFVIIFFILALVIETGDLKYIGFLLLYGLDSVTTIFCRLIRNENIFEAHRSHFYQYLANSLKWPHTNISTTYMVVQTFFNFILIFSNITGLSLILIFIFSGLLFFALRIFVEGKENLFGTQKSK